MKPNSVRHKLSVFSLLLLALWLSGACRGARTATMTQERRQVAQGTWGGQNAQLEVTEGGARVRLTCARGSIDEPLATDAEGRFSAKGTFVAEAVGPTRDAEPQGRPAVYSGVVRDNRMTFTVTVADSKEESGTFELTRGEPGRVRRCH